MIIFDEELFFFRADKVILSPFYNLKVPVQAFFSLFYTFQV